MIFHKLLGRHTADLKASHWEKGYFISHCTTCGREMIKEPGLPWQITGRGA
ncbi:hypothetical protein [Sphingomonas quercus]|uniref:Uncharacterized protein n=1 Tax=Sphingomonas quercus TaxID=2842451 RepID=A0ABS6BH77_9SPHN|nr:hypothetical protein [Sphingomonas quercus]MBU3077653.1 hypothetical protein [Sphingomonas quercus]